MINLPQTDVHRDLVEDNPMTYSMFCIVQLHTIFDIRHDKSWNGYWMWTDLYISIEIDSNLK